MHRTLVLARSVVITAMVGTSLVWVGAGSAHGEPSGAALPAEAVREVTIAGRDGVPTDASAVALNVTAVAAAAPGYATVYPCGAPRPIASNLNFATGATVPNAVIVRPGTDGKVCIVGSQAADALIDVVGWFAADATASWLTAPVRVLDTRTGLGAPATKILGGTTLELTLPTPPAGTTAAVINLTATNTTAPGYLTTHPCGTTPPNASTLNFTADDTVANLAITQPGPTHSICLTPSTTTDLIADLSGWLTTGYTPLTRPTRVLDTRRCRYVVVTQDTTPPVGFSSVISAATTAAHELDTGDAHALFDAVLPHPGSGAATQYSTPFLGSGCYVYSVEQISPNGSATTTPPATYRVRRATPATGGSAVIAELGVRSNPLAVVGQEDSTKRLLVAERTSATAVRVSTLAAGGSLVPDVTLPATGKLATSPDGRFVYYATYIGEPFLRARVDEYDRVHRTTRTIARDLYVYADVIQASPDDSRLLVAVGPRRVVVDIATGAVDQVPAETFVVGWSRDDRVATVATTNGPPTIVTTGPSGAGEVLFTGAVGSKEILAFTFAR